MQHAYPSANAQRHQPIQPSPTPARQYHASASPQPSHPTAKLNTMAVFDFFTRKKRSKTDEENLAAPVRVGGIGENSTYEAAERTNLPLSPFMTRLFAQELPIMDSTSRRRVMDILKNWDGETIETVDDLPQEIRDMMDLY